MRCSLHKALWAPCSSAPAMRLANPPLTHSQDGDADSSSQIRDKNSKHTSTFSP